MLNYLPALFILRRLALSVTSQRPFRWQKYTFLFEAQNNPADFLYTSNGKFIFHQRWRRYFLTLTLVSVQNVNLQSRGATTTKVVALARLVYLVTL